MNTLIPAIIISSLALIISTISTIRFFLLDKDYCEFFILEKGGGNTGLGEHTLKAKDGYVTTILRPQIQLLKGDAFNLKITGIKSKDILPEEKSDFIKMANEGIIKFYYFGSKPIIINLSYYDSKNNLYNQELKITPYYNSKSSKHWNVELSKRQYIWREIFTKYFK
jgi:hypothetical protein